MKRLIFYTVMIIALGTNTACNKKSESESLTSVSSEKKDSSKTNSTLTMEPISIPEVLQNCSCKFSTNSSNFERGKFIYIDDYGNTAYIKIKGQEVSFPMDEGDFDPENFSKKLENSEYIIEINTQKLHEYKEELRYSGEITLIEKKTNEKVSLPIYGVCNC